MLLGDDRAVELVLFALFVGQHVVAPALEGGESALDPARLAAVEPDRAARQVGEKAPVVADHHDRGAAACEFLLQPFDGGKVEVIGRLVEQQDVGGGCEHARKCRPPGLAAGELGRILIAAEPELLQEVARLTAIVAGAEAGLHISEGRGRAGEIGLLRQISNRGPRLHEARPPVGLDQPGGNAQQRRLARPVAADQAHAFAGRDGELDAGEQGCAAERQRNVFELNEGRGHADILRGTRRSTPRSQARWEPDGPKSISNGPAEPRASVGIARVARAGSPHRAPRERRSGPAARTAAARVWILPPTEGHA